MLEALKQEANHTLTENSAHTHLSSNSHCLDLFATIGALRNVSEAEIIGRFNRAWAEDRDLAMKILFFARDIRGGLGERRVFRVLFRNIAIYDTESAIKNLWAVAEFGRFDDLLTLLGTPAKDAVLRLIKTQFETDLQLLGRGEPVSLLGKWLPSINASNADTIKAGKIISKALGLDKKEYRKALAALRAKIAIIENALRQKDYSFDYSSQPSKALFKYRQAFIRNDGERYSSFLGAVSEGKAKMNTGTLLPYEVVRPIFDYIGMEKINLPDNFKEIRESTDVTWNALEDFTRGENALVVADGSASMYWGYYIRPINVAISLAVYFAERNKGAFHNHFITFSENPRLVNITGKDIFEKIRHAASYDEVANTNLKAVFELILKTAVKNNLSQKELPSTIYIISDMEFDQCAEDADITNFEYAKKLFEQYNYKLPDVVFWNVDSRNIQQPVTMHETGVALVSGASPRQFSMITSGIISPMVYMMDVLGSERYAKICA